MTPVVHPSCSVILTSYAPNRWMPLHSHDQDKVSFMLAGSVAEWSRSGERLATAGSLVVKPAGYEHEDRIGNRGLTVLSVRVHGRNTALSESWAKLVSDYRWSPLDSSIKLMMTLWREGIEGTDSIVEELVHRITPMREERACPSWFNAVETILANRLDSPPSLREMADAIAVHPVTLSKAFAAKGTSKAATVHRLRMQAALKRLNTRIPLNSIAAELGYSDASHFTRTFRRWFGVSPQQYRNEFCVNR